MLNVKRTLCILIFIIARQASSSSPIFIGDYIKGSEGPYEKIVVVDSDLEIHNHRLFILDFKSNILKKIKITNSKITSLNLQNKIIQSFEAQNVYFESAKLTGTKIKKCRLSNVTFSNSDLNFSNLKKCTQKNTIYINSVNHEISNY